MRVPNILLISAVALTPPTQTRDLEGSHAMTTEDITIYNRQSELVQRIVEAAFIETQSNPEAERKILKWSKPITPTEVGGEIITACPPHQIKEENYSYVSEYCTSCTTEPLWSKDRSIALSTGLVRVQEALGLEESDVDAGLADFRWTFYFNIDEDPVLINAGAGYTMGRSSSLFTTAAALDTHSLNAIAFHEWVHAWLATHNEKSVHATEEGLAAYLTQIAFPDSHFVAPGNYDVEYLQIAMLGPDYASAVFTSFDEVIDQLDADTNWVGSSAYSEARSKFFYTWEIPDTSSNQQVFDSMYDNASVLKDLDLEPSEDGDLAMENIQTAIETFGLDWPTVWSFYVETAYKEAPNTFNL